MSAPPRGLSRRLLLAGGTFAASARAAAPARPIMPVGTIDAMDAAAHHFMRVHDGLGEIDVRMFDFGGAPAPANFLIYAMPPGTSEGVHIHDLVDPRRGPYDEYYYIVAGRGRMTLDGAPIPVGPGDHVHAPLGVAHGIENIDSRRELTVFLTYIDRSTATRS